MAAAEPDRKAQGKDSVSTRDKIRSVARELFIRRGLSAVSYGDIAERVGTTRANLHYHFGSKTELLTEVFQQTFEEVAVQNREIWLSPGITLDERIGLMLEDARRRFYQFNDDDKGRNHWSLSSRARFEGELLSDEIIRGITSMSKQLEEYVTHAVQLAVGTGELRPDTPVRSVVLLISQLWNFGSPITRFGGFHKLEDHYQATRAVIRDAYGVKNQQT